MLKMIRFICLLLLCLLLPYRAVADDTALMQMMTQAMARMMAAMAQLPPVQSNSSSPAPPATDMTWPWLLPFANPVQTFSLPMPNQLLAPAVTALDGVWEGRDGGLLIIGGTRFRLYQPNAGHVDGLLQRRDNQLALYNPSNGVTNAYEYAESQGRLALRDRSGNLFLYRRLWLDQMTPNEWGGGEVNSAK
ncbi:hypothetical protein HUU62_15520 [Rhodoferax sp. 4810]|uniref:Uncharacterized protein n=1 Tax=Thiospirillum jenense TaxID=1653858 RepID=A0A839HJ72_9GAMM|nr:hypothetical protein [Thiospirillum jenense]MBB1075813.1 hypothetical protein [Rhodoferax jenense]MBB1126888.1 hypothetical protein [Thiospirillum jenense]